MSVGIPWTYAEMNELGDELNAGSESNQESKIPYEMVG